jgi:hypothetical protein
MIGSMGLAAPIGLGVALAAAGRTRGGVRWRRQSS